MVEQHRVYTVNLGFYGSVEAVFYSQSVRLGLVERILALLKKKMD